MDRAAAFLGLFATALAAGALLIGAFVVTPGLREQAGLVDANLAIRMAEPQAVSA